MDYPIWDLPIVSGAMLWTIFAIGHTILSHYALGATLINVLTETFTPADRDEAQTTFLRTQSGAILWGGMAVGGVAGLGYLICMALVNPETMRILAMLFWWLWGFYACCLLAAVIAGVIYRYGWDRLKRWMHVLVGWILVLAALGCLFAFTVLTNFFLQPEESLKMDIGSIDFAFWQGVFTNLLAPGLVLRLIASLALGALGAILLINVRLRFNEAQRVQLIRQVAWYLTPLVLMIPAAAWFLFGCPPHAMFYLQGGAIAMLLLLAFCLTISVLLGMYAYGALIVRRRAVGLETSILLVLLAIMATGSSEFVREGMHKPYLIWKYVYSNGIVKSDFDLMTQAVIEMEAADRKRMPEVLAAGRPISDAQQATVLRFFPWSIKTQDEAINERARQAVMQDDWAQLIPVEDYVRGEWLYNGQCLRCHCIDGYNGIRPLVKTWSPKQLNNALRELEIYRGFMPPFVGSARDRQDLAIYMHRLNGACTQCHDNVDDEGNLLDSDKDIGLKEDWKRMP